MEPFLTYALISSAINLVAKPVGELVTNKLSDKQKEAIELKDHQHKLDLDMLRATKEYDMLTKLEVQKESFNQRLQEAKYQYEIYMKKWQDQAFDQRVWPIKTPYENFSLKPVTIQGHNDCTIIPCRIFIAKSNKNQDYSRYLENTINGNLSMYFENGYRMGDSHPVISSIGDWKSDDLQEDAFINALSQGMQGQPVIVLNPLTTDNGNTLNIRISFWGLGTNGGYASTQTTTVARLDIGREKGLLIREESRYLLECGMINNISHELKFNYDLIQSEENAPTDKMEILMEKNLGRYRLAAEVVNDVNKRLSKKVSEIMCCFAGLYCDAYYLIEYGLPPIMPGKILKYSLDNELVEDLGKLYQGILARLALSGYHGKNIEKIYVKTALKLNENPLFQHFASEIMKEGISLWGAGNAAEQKDILIPEELKSCTELLAKYRMRQDDDQLFEDISTFFRINGNKELEEKMQRIIARNDARKQLASANKQPAPKVEEILRNEKKITIIGPSGTGKNSFITAMCDALKSGYEGLRLYKNPKPNPAFKNDWNKAMQSNTDLAKAMQAALDLTKAMHMHAAREIDKAPPNNVREERAAYRLKDDVKELLPFEIIDYAGRTILIFDALNEEITKSVKNSESIILWVDGSEFIQMEAVGESTYGSAQAYLKIFSEIQTSNGCLPPIVIAIANSDKGMDGAKLKEKIEETFRPLFVNDGVGNKIVAVIPVAMGKNNATDDYDGVLEPVNPRLALLFSVWSILLEDIRKINRIKGSMLFKRFLADIGLIGFFKNEKALEVRNVSNQVDELYAKRCQDAKDLYSVLSSELSFPVYINGIQVELEDLIP